MYKVGGRSTREYEKRRSRRKRNEERNDRGRKKEEGRNATGPQGRKTTAERQSRVADQMARLLASTWSRSSKLGKSRENFTGDDQRAQGEKQQR